jgi:transposase-like protein
MPPVDRKNPVRAKSSESSTSVMEFVREFPDDEACLQWLWRNKYSPDGEFAYCPRCATARRFKRYETTPRTQTWTCTACTRKISPTAGTIFHKSSTSLHLWFYAMFIMTSTRCGVSAKQLERELGVTYKTAWRMFNKIRNVLMAQDYAGPLSGAVEVDETFIGGKLRQTERNALRAKGIMNAGPGSKKRATVLGMVERQGKVHVTVIPNSRGHHLRNAIREKVLPESMIYTDDWSGYERLGDKYRHKRINHSAKVYVDGNVHTQTIEGFFSTLKNGIRGSYHSVSTKWLQGYLNEYAWRYNHRDDAVAMFKTLLLRATVS